MFAQYISNGIIRTPNEGMNNRIRLRFLMKIRKFILKYYDPCIEYELEKSPSIYLPFSHSLPLILKTYSQYSSNLPRIAAKVKKRYNNMTFIDIGANVGDTVALLRREEFFPILCIEGEESFFKYLQKNTSKFSDVYLEKVFIGAESKYVYGKIDINNGTAKISREDETKQAIQIKKLSDILGNYAMFSKSKMIKIDTDGFDCMIIRGSIDLLKVTKPIIYFEYDPFLLGQQSDEGISVFSELQSIGYENALVYDNIGTYMMSIKIADKLIVKEMHNYFLHRHAIDNGYCDVCAFHAEDWQLFEELRIEELNRF